MVTVNVCPFEYLPLQRKLYRFDQINITINYTIGTIEYQARISERRHKITQDYVKSFVQNPTIISSGYKTANQIVSIQSPTITSSKLIIPWKPSSAPNVAIPDYIIITNETLKNSFKPFVQYKISRGIPTLLVTVEQIYANYAGCDNPEKIRNYLKAAHQFWGAGLFVLLGGDTAVVPGRMGSRIHNVVNGIYQHNYTDFYYCDVYKEGLPNHNWNSSGDDIFGNRDFNKGYGNGNDIFDIGADNFIGRAPVDTIEEVNYFIAKVIKYEKLEGVTNINYVNNMLFLGAYILKNPTLDTYPHGQLWHYLLANKPFLNNSAFKKWLVFDHYLGNNYSSTNPLYSEYYLGNEKLERSTVLTRMSDGLPNNGGKFHLVSHLDHGSPFGIGTSGVLNHESIFREDMDRLSNGNDLQIMYTSSCDSGEFNVDCYAEHYINAQSGGGVAILANSGSVYTGANNQDNELFNSIYGNSSPTSYIMGLAFGKARDAYTGGLQQKQLTLFGEPTMAVWSATPQNISLTVQSSLTMNNAISNIFPITINPLSEKATITLYKFNTALQITEVYASQTLEVGVTTAQFTVNPDTTGIMTVKVTAKNYLPATANVNILFPQAHLYVSGYTFVDSNGNGFIEQGETINLSVNLTNSGSTNITLVNAALSCNALYGTVNNGSVSSSQINAGQTVTLSGFTFTAGNNNSLPNFIEFMLNITANGGYVHLDNFFLDLKNPVLTIGARTMTVDNVVTNNFQLNKAHSLKIALSNIGDVPSGTLTATLSTPMTNVVIATASSTYLSINNSIGVNVAPFVFSFTGTTFLVGAKPFILTLTNPLGKSWTFNFDLNEALPPLISGFKFTSTTSEIKPIWNPVTNIGGYNVYRSNQENGTYSKINTFLVSGSSTYTDLTVNPATIYYYKISVVTASGNERPLDQVVTNGSPALQGYKAWTSLDAHEAFPINASGTNDCQTAPTLFDVNGDGK